MDKKNRKSSYFMFTAHLIMSNNTPRMIHKVSCVTRHAAVGGYLVIKWPYQSNNNNNNDIYYL